jgi:hypothetical protein
VKLSEALREAADDLAGYDVVDRAIARGRWRRRLVTAAAAVSVLAILGAVTAVVAPELARDDGVAEPTSGPSIPERIGFPGLFPRDAATAPPGPASVIFSGGGGDLVVVGATSDTYRSVDTDSDAGWDALLSPAGDRIAYTDGRQVVVVDLVRGGTRTYGPGADTVDGFRPEAWLPDGSGLVVMSRTEADDPTTQGIVVELSIMDFDTGGLDPFAEATWPIATPGFAVAVSPDGSRIAYQYWNFVSVFDRRTGEKTRFDLENGSYAIAGRSAWAPDGSLTLIRRDWETSYRRWDLLLVDPATGAPRETVGSVRDRQLIRLIGWSGSRPVVVGYDGECYVMFTYGDVLSRDTSCSVGVYELFGDAEQVLVRPAAGVFHVDVAESLLADPQRRPGDPPWTVPTWIWVVLVVLAGLGVWRLLTRWITPRKDWISPRGGDRGRSSGPGAA